MSKKNKKLVKTRKTRSTEESSDDDLSPTRRSKPESEIKSSLKLSEKELLVVIAHLVQMHS